MYKYHRIICPLNVKTVFLALGCLKKYNRIKHDLKKILIKIFDFNDFEFFDSGRHALYAAIADTDETKSDVIIPLFSCPIIPVVIKEAGKTPVYADVEPTSFSIDFADVQKKITKQTAAVIVVHEFGNPVSIVKLKELRGFFDGIIIEDAAIALGSTYLDGTPVGQIGDYTIFSGGLGKPVSANSWGGLGLKHKKAFMTASSEMRSSIKSIINILALLFIRHYFIYNLTRALFSKKVKEDATDFPEKLMLPSRLDNILMLTQIEHLKTQHSIRRENGRKIINLFNQHGIQTLNTKDNSFPVFSKIPFILPREDHTKKLIAIFKAYGIEITRPYRSNFITANMKDFRKLNNIYEKTLTITVNNEIKRDFFKNLSLAITHYKTQVV